jgi:hypothetical protein
MVKYGEINSRALSRKSALCNLVGLSLGIADEMLERRERWLTS